MVYRKQALKFALAVLANAVSASALTVAMVAAQDGLPYRIGPGDEVEVRVEELPDVDRDYEVAADGTIELPHAGSIAAGGRTEGQLAADIRSRLEASGLRRATVSVRVRRPSRPVAVLGAVADPGNFPLVGRATVLDVLLEAGGSRPIGAPSSWFGAGPRTGSPTRSRSRSRTSSSSPSRPSTSRSFPAT